MKIKIKRTVPGTDLPKIVDKGEWIDLRVAKDVALKGPEVADGKVKFHYFLISLGVAMKLPAGTEAVIVPRSSTYKNFGIILANSEGVIDNSYSGDTDEWKFCAIPLRDVVLYKGERICQFRVQLSQKATLWQKIRWFFSSGIELEEVNILGGNNRGGFGSTGKV